MNAAQKKAAMDAMVEWLSHPGELGKAPAKIEHAGEFDLYDMHYYMFKYKSSMFGKWLLGVCGGYEGDELEHCGHVFSAMEEYSADTAVEEAIKIVEHVRAFWMQKGAEIKAQQEAGEDAEEEPISIGPFVSFVLLSTPEWDHDAICKALKDEWGISVGEDPQNDDNAVVYKDEEEDFSIIWEQDGMMATVSLMSAPVPGGEAEHNAANNREWPEAVEVTKTHTAHLLVAVLPRENGPIEAGKLLVKINAVCLGQENALGVYTSGTVFQPEFYRRAAEFMHKDELPLLNWLYFGLFRTSENAIGGYTYGLNMFGKDEIEVLNSAAQPGDLRGFLYDISNYILEYDVTLRDGETIGFTAEQKLPITRSPGFFLDFDTLKIGFMPAE